MRKFNFPIFNDPNGSLTVFEVDGKAGVPFTIARIFTVVANSGCVRGNHAHYRCSQLLYCLSGQILLTLSDGVLNEEQQLLANSQGVLIPPGVWSSQKYQENKSVLMVMCDRGYEESDYIRDYEIFAEYKSKNK